MRKHLALLLILALLPLLLLPSVASAAPFVSVSVSADRFQPRDRLSLLAGIQGSGARQVDLYLGLLVPGTPAALFMGPDLAFSTDPTAALTGWQPVPVPDIDLSSYTFTGVEPEGDYFWCGVMYESGSTPGPETLVGPISCTPFHFSPHGIIDWFPHEGSVFETTEPDMQLHFSRAVRGDSVEQHVEVAIESLTSGKRVEVIRIDGERWVVADIPEVATVYRRVSDDEYISHTWDSDGTRLVLHVGSYTVFGMNFSLHRGGSYELTLRLLQGGSFADGSVIPSRVIGPLTFSIAEQSAGSGQQTASSRQ
jgi:hypothetical protein